MTLDNVQPLCLRIIVYNADFFFSDSDGCAHLFFLGFFMFLSSKAGDVVTEN